MMKKEMKTTTTTTTKKKKKKTIRMIRSLNKKLPLLLVLLAAATLLAGGGAPAAAAAAAADSSGWVGVNWFGNSDNDIGQPQLLHQQQRMLHNMNLAQHMQRLANIAVREQRSLHRRRHLQEQQQQQQQQQPQQPQWQPDQDQEQQEQWRKKPSSQGLAYPPSSSSSSSPLLDGMEGMSLQPICRVLENNFLENVRCVCTGSSVSSFSVSCDFQESVCSPLGTVCGKPFVALSLVDFEVFSTTSCIYNYTRNSEKLDDTCLSMEVCPDSYGYVAADDGADGNPTAQLAGTSGVQFCGCVAQHASQTCSECRICDGGNGGKTGVFMNCSNVNAEIVSDSCEAIDVDVDFGGATSQVSGFVPNLNGLCSQLEGTLDNGAVECSCNDAGGGNFNVTCETPELRCDDRGVCGKVKSKVGYRDGRMDRITSCSDYMSPLDLKETCVNLALHNDDAGAGSDEKDEAEKGGSRKNGVIEHCSATYGGTACRSCSTCAVERDGGDVPEIGLNIDCSNVAEWASTSGGECQVIGRHIEQALEFVPEFADIPESMLAEIAARKDADDGGDAAAAASEQQSSSSPPFTMQPAAISLLAFAGVVMIW